MEDILRKSLQTRYDIEVLKLNKYRQLWVIDSIKKRLIIKPYKSPHVINRLYSLNKSMKSKGFDSFPMPLLNKNHSPYFKINEHYYMVMPYIEGKTPSFAYVQDVIKITSVLAEFHHSCGFLNSGYNLNHCSLIYYKLENRLLRFKGLYRTLLNKKDKTTIEQKILLLGESMITFGEEALRNLNKELLNQYYQDAYDNNLLAHRDVASHNFILNKRGWMIDFDITGVEPQFLDLWQLLNRSMLEAKWSLEEFVQIEASYNQNKRLRDGERRLIRELSLFPNDFIRESLGLYLYPEKFNKGSVIKILDNYLHNFDAYLLFRGAVCKV